jgi:site-specific DNA recombinase
VPRSSRLKAVADVPGRAVAYIRVSSVRGRGGDDFYSPDIQLSAIRRLTTGMQEVAVVDDDIDQSGTTFERQGVDVLRDLAEDRLFDVLAVYNVARFGRNTLEGLTFLSWLADRGITIISATEPIDTSTPTGRWMLTQMLSVAQLQAETIGDGWSKLIAYRAQAGHHHGRPLGYTRVDKTLVPDPLIGPVMAEAFKRYADDVPISRITAYVSAARGVPMQHGNLKKNFRNPAYLGFVIDAGEILPGVHVPLVEQDVWDRVQARLARDAGVPARHLNPTWSLVGMVYCPDDHRLQRQPHTHRLTGEQVQRLICGRVNSRVSGGCKGIGSPLLDRVEEEVLRQVAAYIVRLRTDVGTRAAQLARAASARADAASLKREQAKLKREMVKLTREFGASDTMPREAYDGAMAELRQAEGAVSAELASIGTAARAAPPEEAANAAEAMLKLWPDLLPDERGQVLRTVVRKVIVRKAAYWREPEADRVTIPDEGGWV